MIGADDGTANYDYQLGALGGAARGCELSLELTRRGKNIPVYSACQVESAKYAQTQAQQRRIKGGKLGYAPYDCV